MKNIIVVSAIIIVLLIGIVLFYFLREEPTFSFQSFHFGYSSSSIMNGDVSYDVTCNKQCIATIKPFGEDPRNSVRVTLSSKEVEKLMHIIHTYHVTSWNGFHKSDPHVLDGSSFSFHMVLEDGKEISASGYMKYPNHYSEVKQELDTLFEPYMEELWKD